MIDDFMALWLPRHKNVFGTEVIQCIERERDDVSCNKMRSVELVSNSYTLMIGSHEVKVSCENIGRLMVQVYKRLYRVITMLRQPHRRTTQYVCKIRAIPFNFLVG